MIGKYFIVTLLSFLSSDFKVAFQVKNCRQQCLVMLGANCLIVCPLPNCQVLKNVTKTDRQTLEIRKS